MLGARKVVPLYGSVDPQVHAPARSNPRFESDLSYLLGPAAITAMVYGEGHQALVRDGSAHIPAFPIVEIDGDAARAVAYTRVYRHTGEGYEVWRVSANYWEFRRDTDGWRVTRRTNHVIDGGPEAKELLARAVARQS